MSVLGTPTLRRWFGRVLHLLIFCSVIFVNNSLAEEFIVFGHAQDLVPNKKGYQLFLKNIESENVGNIFILGDSNLGDPNILNNLEAETKSIVHAVPGNHEYMDGIESYLDNFGQTNKAIETNKAIFLLLDSNQGLEDILILLKNWRDKYFDSDKVIVLLTHHRIWDDSILSVSPYKHDKSYYFRDVYPLLSGFVHYVIAGNSKRQHFQDLRASLKKGSPPNISTSYWEEVFPSFKAYNVGMGNGQPYATYIKFSVLEETLMLQSKAIKVSNDALASNGILDSDKFVSVLRDKTYSIPQKIFRQILMLYNKLYLFILGVVVGVMSIVIIFKYKKTG